MYMANEEILDLDKLIPETKKIRISGKVVDLYPGKLKTLIKLQKAFLAFQNGNADTQAGLLDDVMECLAILVPAIKDEDLDISMAQLPVLIEVAYRASMPTEAKVPTTVQKKTPEEASPEQ